MNNSVYAKANSADLADMAKKITDYTFTDFIYATNPFYIGAVAGGTCAATLGVPNHPGIYVYTSHASTVDSGGRINSAMDAIVLNGGEKFAIIFKTPAVLTGITRRFGFHDTSTITAPADGVYCRLADDAGKHYITGHTVNNTTLSTTTTKFELAPNTWYRAVIEINDALTLATFKLYADDSENLLWTDTLNGSNIPKTVGRELGVADICSLATPSAATIIGYIDYMSYESSARRVR